MTILVGFTGTTGGEDALSTAAMLANALDTGIEVVMILPKERAMSALTPPSQSYISMVREQARSWLNVAAEHNPEIQKTTIKTHIRYANGPTEGLIESIEEFGPVDGLVVGGGRHGGFGRITLGSIGSTLVFSCPVPLAIAPRGMRNRKATPLTRLTVGVGTKGGRIPLLEEAKKYARQSGAAIRLISLLPLDTPDKKAQVTATQAAKDHALQALEQARELIGSDIEITTDIALGDSIEDAAQSLDWQPGEIMMLGSGRLAAPKRLFLTSTGNKILRSCPVPLLIVPRGDVTS